MAEAARKSSRKAKPKGNNRTSKPAFECRPHLKALAPYPPGRPIEDVRREYGLEKVIKMASNENPLGPSPKAVEALRRCAREVNFYPDGNAYYLRRALSRKLGVAPDHLMFGNGSDELVVWLALTYLSPRDSVIVSEHSFIRYRMAAQLIGARWKTIPLAGWSHDLDAMARAVTPSTRMIFLANPENPVGTIVGRREFERFLASVPPSVLIILDQAYFEYVRHKDYFDGIDYIAGHPNLVVLRTFSKAYGLAGLRIGYGIAHPDVVADVNRVRPPFNVNRPAQEAAIAALEDSGFLRRAIETNEAGRRYLYGEFEKLGLEYVPSHTNFVLVRVGRAGRDGAWFAREMMKRGVIVRPMGGYGLPDHIRVTIGRAGDNRTFVKVLKEVGELAR